MKFAKMGIFLALVLTGSPAFAADGASRVDCAQGLELYDGAFTKVVQQYDQEVQRGRGEAAAAFLNGDLLAVAPAELSRSKAELDRIGARLAAQGCPSAPGWRGDWTRL